MRARNWTSPMRPTMLGKARIDAITLYGRANQLSVYQQAINAARAAGGPYLDVPDNLAQTWQDSAGTIPATIGSTVGLLTDRSFGGELGPELFNHADAEMVGASSVVSPGEYRILSTDGADSGVRIQNRVDPSKSYVMSFRVVSRAAGTVFAENVGGRNSVGVFTAIGPPLTTSLYIRRSGVTNAVITDISVRELKGNHATQATAGNRPVLTTHNGKPILSFDGSNDSMQLATNPIGATLSQPYTIIVGGVVGALGTQRSLFGDNSRIVRIFTDGTLGITHSGIGSRQAATGIAAGAPFVMSLTFDGALVKIEINGAEVVSSALAPPTGAAVAMFIGQRGNNSEYWNGLLLPVFATGSVVPEAQRRQIGRGMAQKLGVTYA